MNCFNLQQIESALESNDELLTHRFEKHIEECDTCRDQLEKFVGSESDWSSACLALQNISSELEDLPTVANRPFESTFLLTGPVNSDAMNSDAMNSDLINTKHDRSSRVESSPEESRFQTGQGRAAESSERLDSLNESRQILNPPAHPENLGSIGRYEIERTIGRGGMGIVFKGFDAELNRPVAIKILSPHLADHGTARQRFTREAKAAAAVVHDNVVPLFDIHSDTDRPYLVMPFVNGVSLQEYVDKNGQIGTKDILRVALQIASGLSAAHAQGLIHRDIKPANILLENGLNRVQITDFGLARAVDDAAMTYSGMIAGTPHYMSPEQSKGESLDHRSDLFSLGCVMYFMATGRTLYRGDGPFSVLAQVPKGNFAPVREINPKIPAFVEDVIHKLLESQPQNRFQSAANLSQHLERALAYLHQPTAQKAPQRIWSSRKKKQMTRWVLGTFLTLLLIAGSFSLANGWRAFKPTPEPNGSTSKTFATADELDQELDTIENELLRLEQQLQFPDVGYEHLEYSLDQELDALSQALTPAINQDDESVPKPLPSSNALNDNQQPAAPKINAAAGENQNNLDANRFTPSPSSSHLSNSQSEKENK